MLGKFSASVKVFFPKWRDIYIQIFVWKRYVMNKWASHVDFGKDVDNDHAYKFCMKNVGMERNFDIIFDKFQAVEIHISGNSVLEQFNKFTNINITFLVAPLYRKRVVIAQSV
jgi:hypothetical protein